MAMWIGLGMRESFGEWKTWTKKRIKQRRRDARKVKLFWQSTKNGVDFTFDDLGFFMNSFIMMILVWLFTVVYMALEYACNITHVCYVYTKPHIYIYFEGTLERRISSTEISRCSLPKNSNKNTRTSALFKPER